MVEAILVLPWRAYPAAVLVLVGAGLVVAGAAAAWDYRGHRQSYPEWALAYLFVFRRVVVGLAVIGVGVGWAGQMPGVFGAALCIGLGELLESTYYIEVLRWGQRHGVAWLTPSR
jgi:hypothetical protein